MQLPSPYIHALPTLHHEDTIHEEGGHINKPAIITFYIKIKISGKQRRLKCAYYVARITKR